jgi:hypothetical protein
MFSKDIMFSSLLCFFNAFKTCKDSCDRIATSLIASCFFSFLFLLMHNSKVIFKPELIAQLNVSLVYSLKLCKLDQKYCELVILSDFLIDKI